MRRKNKFTKGFTFIEVLMAIAIIALIATVVVVAIDPAKRFQDARNAKRQTDIRMILKAVHQYRLDNRGEFPGLLTEGVEQGLGTSSVGCDISTNGCNSQEAMCIDLIGPLERSLKAIPYDPKDGAPDITYYTIVRDSNNVVTVKACRAEGEDDIYVSQ